MFSIIIPLYNKTACIEKCLQSILYQTYQDFEVIVVNDGSTDDGVEKVIKIIAQSREQRAQSINSLASKTSSIQIKLLNQPNSGVSTARNNGVKAAKFNYFAFLDADDWWDKHFLGEMKGLIEEFPNAGLYGCNYFYVKNGRKKIDFKGFPEDFKAGYIDYIKTFGISFCVPFNCSFVVVPRIAFNEVGSFNPGLKYGEDFDLWIRIALQKKVAYLNKPLAYSNQDADKSWRAVGNSHFFEPENHYIFNLDYLLKEEHSNSDLKYLLDGLRVRSLIKYYYYNRFSQKLKIELSKVNFDTQPIYFKFIYSSPKWIVNLFFLLRNLTSSFKQFLISKNRKLYIN